MLHFRGFRLPALAAAVLMIVSAWALPARAQLDPVIANEFANTIPASRFHRVNATTEFIYGAELARGDSPEHSATAFIDQWRGMLGRDVGEFIAQTDEFGDVLKGAMFDRATGQHRFKALRLVQHYDGVPVFRAGVGMLVRNEPGFPLVMVSAGVREFAETNFAIDPGMAPEVTPAMLAGIRQKLDEQAALQLGPDIAKRLARMKIETADQTLVIWAGIDDVPAAPEAAVTLMASRGSVQTWPHYQKVMMVVSPATGAVRLAENQICFTDITGNVSGRATQGIATLECNAEAAVALPYAEVQVVGGNSAFANASGNYTITHGGTTAVTVRSLLRGRFFDVRDQSAGNVTPQIDQTSTPPGPANFLHNPADGQEFPNANVNAYLESNVVRDYVLLHEPAYPVIATQLGFLVNTNIANSCNAFYNGTSINFYRNGGGCHNTAFSDVVYHEYGHHLVNVTGNGQGQFGEGSGDCVGVLIQDEPILGNGFQGNCSAGIRNANNTLQYPCTSAIHFCGQVLSGAVWDTRNQLIVTEPSQYRTIGAQLFFGMQIVRGQMLPGNSTIDPTITLIYLQLDDNDSTIGNGTPHYNEIATGFGLHNLDAPALDPIAFEYPDGRPELISPAGGTAFSVRVSALAQTPQPGTGVLHVNRGSGFEAFAMPTLGTNLYAANFPPSTCGTELKYYVSVQTTTGATVTNPSTAPTGFYTATAANSLTAIFDDNGETNPGWTVVTTATDGPWGRGVPVGGGDRGDPPTDYDGSGQCWLTDNVDGNSDVDAGSTVLTSPILNPGSANNEELLLTYARWYSNHTGGAPEADVFTVEVSNNGGSSWTTLEVVGPTGPEVRGGWFLKTFRLRNTIATTNQMRVRFTASDLGTGSVVEAGVDAVRLSRVVCGPTSVPPTSFDVVVGENVQGGLPELASSDNQRMNIESSVPPEADATNNLEVRLVLERQLASPTPSTLAVRLEGNATVPQCSQSIELFNFQTGQYETVDVRLASENTDAVADVQPGGSPLRFVQTGTGLVRARVKFIQSPLVSEILWSARIDQFVWLVQ
jgi:hypothetical protein